MPGRKTDNLDSEWIAELCLNGQIKPSFIPSKEIRELRDLTRTRTKTIQTMTAFKNRVHKVLQRANIRISGILKDIFGIAGLQILNINREPYKENDETPIKSLKLPKDKVPNTMSPDEMIKMLSDAGYVVSKPVMG